MAVQTLVPCVLLALASLVAMVHADATAEVMKVVNEAATKEAQQATCDASIPADAITSTNASDEKTRQLIGCGMCKWGKLLMTEGTDGKAPTEADYEAQAEKAAAFFGPDAVALHTITNEVLTTPDMIKSYLATTLLPRRPALTVDQAHVRKLSDDVFAVTGLYTFTFGDNGEIMPARFTFVFSYDDSKWALQLYNSAPLVASDDNAP